MCTLMPHNKKAVDEIRKYIEKGKKNILYVAGVGTGKSYVVKYLLENDFKGERITYVVPKHSIADYLSNEAGFSEYDNIRFLTYNYFESIKKGREVFEESDLIICDEAHHVGSELYGKTMARLMKKKLATVLGLTATPIRDADRTNVNEYFQAQVTGISNFEAIRCGIMPKFEYIICTPSVLREAEKDKKVVLDYNDSEEFLMDIIRDNPRNKWIAFFPNTRKLNETKSLIKKLYPDYHLVTLYASLNNTEKALREIREHEKCIVLSCNILLEGLHMDSVGGIILFRDVTSLTVFQQILGRTCQIGKKENPVVVDCTETAVRMMRKLLKEDGKSRGVSERGIFGTHHDILSVSLCNKRYYDISRFLFASGQYDEFEFRGKTYSSLTAACAQYNLNRQLVLKRAQDEDMDIEEVMESMLSRGETIKKGTVIYRGEEYTTSASLMKTYDIDPDRGRAYMKKTGLSLEEMIDRADTLDLKKKGKKEFVVNGTVYRNIREFCEDNKIPTTSVYAKAKRKNISHEEAAKILLDDKINGGFWYHGERYKTLRECCNAVGVRADTISYKVKQLGYTYEEAIDETIENKRKAADTGFTILGTEYPSLTQFVKVMGVGKSTIYKLENKGYTRQEAMEHIARQKAM